VGGFIAAVPRKGPASEELIQRAIAASRDRAPDGVRHVVTPEGVLLVQCMFANTPESVGEKLPLADPSGRVWIVKRGHLNNIDELRGRLRDRLGSDVRVHTDAEVMLASYLAWGEDMAGKINGEFTLAIWDGRNHTLFVLRDHLGLRGCYVHDGPEWYIAASEPAQILPFPGVSDELDEYGIVDFISGWPVDRVRTLYRDIRRPMPATATTVRGSGVRSPLYWHPIRSRERARRGPEAYADEVFATFKRAVLSHLRSPTPVMCELSGGLDSAAVLGAAALLRSENPDGVPPVEASSRLYPGMDCDESEYIREVIAMWQTPWIGHDGLAEAADISRFQLMGSMRYIVGRRSPGLLGQVRRLEDLGCRVLLTGNGGDEVFLAGELPLARPLRPSGEIWPYFWWTSRRSVPLLARRVRRELLRPHVPAGLVGLYLRLKGVQPAEGSLLTERALDMHRSMASEARCFVARHEQLEEDLWGAGSLSASGLNDAVTMRSRFEIRAPFLDQTLVELVLDVPMLVHRWRGQWRALQKTAFSPLYPESVRTRRTKAEFTQASVSIDMPTPLRHSELAGRDLVDERAVNERLRAIRMAVLRGDPPPFAWSALAVRDFETWRSPLRVPWVGPDEPDAPGSWE
jgi:asparagine synthase (glutamine-hydrolysing)